MQEKYVIHEDEDGDFAIVDGRSYEIIECAGWILEGLPFDTAASLISFLEELDRRKELPN